MKPPADAGSLKRITASKRYSSGKAHFALDYSMPIGTPVFAVGDGTILDCNDGVRDQPRGKPAGSGAPSNWVLLATRWNGKPVTVYYQHLTRGLKVKRGDKVREGQQLASSGNSGNTSGPHLHIAVSRGHRKERYAYLANGGNNDVVIFSPSQLWGKSPFVPGQTTIHLTSLVPGKRNADVRIYQKALRAFGHSALNPSGVTGYYGPETKAMTRAAYTKLGWTTGDLTRPGPKLLAKLGLKVA
jgi:murein DD-endopeptidase MepM/ murein hydrolase activator NlpD